MTVSGRVLEDLVDAATGARQRAYAPYSHFAVGAAVIGGSGATYTGANVENASYGLTMCAERAAIFAAVSAGERQVLAVAVVTAGREVVAPCGACRQVIHEFGPRAQILCVAGALRKTWTLDELLPVPFGPASLATDAPATDESR